MLISRPLPVTCGLVICSPEGWLLGHSTNTPFWDLPKGKMEPNEHPLDAALRECEEETGLDLRAFREHFQDLGWNTYNRKRGKTLRLYRLDLETSLDLQGCASQTLVKRGPEHVVDMDAFAWVPPDLIHFHVKPRMTKYLRRQGLLPEPAMDPRARRPVP